MAIPQNLLAELEAEHDFAVENFAPFHSAHEGLAIIQEEFEELKSEVFCNQNCRSTGLMHNEALQLAAMALRFIIDVCPAQGRDT